LSYAARGARNAAKVGLFRSVGLRLPARARPGALGYPLLRRRFGGFVLPVAGDRRRVAAARLRLAALEIFPQGRPQPRLPGGCLCRLGGVRHGVRSRVRTGIWLPGLLRASNPYPSLPSAFAPPPLPPPSPPCP